MRQAVRDVEETKSALGLEPAWFRPALISLTIVGAVVRVAFAANRFGQMLPGDARFYYSTGSRLASGDGFVQFSTHPHVLFPTAQHPPVLPALLAVVNLVGLDSINQQRVVLSIIATAAVPLMALLGRRIAGPSVGVGAAAIAAISPLWFQPSGILMSEGIYLVLVPLGLLLAIDCIEQPRPWRFGVLGATIGLAALTRSEAIDFVLLLGVPVVLLISGSWKKRLSLGLVLLAGFVVVLVPWMVRNEFQLGGLALSDNIGGTLSGSYCPSTLNPKQADYGAWNFTCTVREVAKVQKEKPPTGQPSWTEVTRDHRIISDTLSYFGSHLSEMPRVMVAREEAMLDIGDWSYQLQFAVDEGRDRTAEEIGMALDWLLVPFGVYGAVQLARYRTKAFIVIIMPVVVVLANVAFFYGSTRMRVAAEPSLVVLGVIGLLEVISKMRRRPSSMPWHVAGGEDR